MSQSSNIAGAVHYDRTLVLAIELSSKSWVLAAQVPGLPQIKAKLYDGITPVNSFRLIFDGLFGDKGAS